MVYNMKSITVYLGAKKGHNDSLKREAQVLGRLIAVSGYRLIYGGGSQGLMGILAQTAMAHGGQVTGIIPKHLIQQEKPFSHLDQLIITETMQERKQLMEQKGDGFIIMPGGIGTLEETFEVWNTIKIGLLNKPIGFLNVEGYFDELFTFINSCVKRGLISAHHAKIPSVSADPESLLNELTKHERFISQEELV